jgi:hypothetical protein
MALTNIGGQEGQGLINTKVWEAIDKDLGEVTDVRLIHHKGYSSITYKSNGEDKKISISGNNIRSMIHASLYYLEAFTHHEKRYQAFY